MLAMVVSSLCFPMLGVVVRAVRQQDDVFTVMFFSGLLNCIALWTVLLVREKRGAFRTSIPHVHLIRGALGALGATSIVYSMKFVQVDLALTVLMSSPVWSALLARFWLKEELNWATWLAIGLGFCGILITANPGVEGLNLWVLLILVPAVGMSLQNTMMTRFTGLGESPWKWSAFNELGILVSSCLLWFSLERTFVDLESAWFTSSFQPSSCQRSILSVMLFLTAGHRSSPLWDMSSFQRRLSTAGWSLRKPRKTKPTMARC